MRGARAVHKVLIEDTPQINIAIIIVWIDMLAGDSENTAKLSAKMFEEHQVRQFHDSNGLVGKTIAESLGASNATAWDTYLIYDKGSEWQEHVSAPLYWVHQLDDPWADPDHFAWGDDLLTRLREIVNNLIES